MGEKIISIHQKCYKNCTEETCAFGLCECLNALKRGIDLNDSERFKAEQTVFKNQYRYSNIPKEYVEKRFIIDSLSKIPLDQLKHLVNFQYFDPNDETLRGKSREMDNFLDSLSANDCDKMTLELTINKRIKKND